MFVWQHKLFIFMLGVAANPSEIFHLPRDRVVELGSQVTP